VEKNAEQSPNATVGLLSPSSALDSRAQQLNLKRTGKYPMNIRYLLPILLTCLLAPLVSPSKVMATDPAPRRIEVKAKRFAYEPAVVTLKAGEPVDLVITSTDVPHGIHFQEPNLSAKITKGKPSELAFTPTKSGDFVGHCSVFCGSGHGSMTLTLHVVN
jgi:cytochrome c oxidase subunit II